MDLNKIFSNVRLFYCHSKCNNNYSLAESDYSCFQKPFNLLGNIWVLQMPKITTV